MDGWRDGGREGGRDIVDILAGIRGREGDRYVSGRDGRDACLRMGMGMGMGRMGRM